MRKLAAVVVVLALVGVAVSALPASARNAPNAKYFLGNGDAKGSDVTFIVSDGKVRKALTNSGAARCERGRSRLLKSFAAIPIHGNVFKRDSAARQAPDRFVLAGRVYGGQARGRMMTSSGGASTGQCNSGLIRWEAERVSKKKWKQNRHGYQLSPPTK